MDKVISICNVEVHGLLILIVLSDIENKYILTNVLSHPVLTEYGTSL